VGKGNRATRKELEKIIGQMIRQLNHLETAVKAIDHYTGLYVAWKGDTIAFNQHIEEKFKESEGVENDKEQQSKVQPPL